MIIATTLIVAFLGFLVLSFLFSSGSPLNALLFPEKHKKMEKQKQAIILYDSKQWDKARTKLEKLVEENPDDTLYIYMLGTTYARLGYPEKAIGKLKRVIELDPKHHEAFGSMASIYYKYGEDAAENGSYEKARDYYKMAEGKIAQALNLAPDKLAYQEIQKQIIEEQERLP